jgi:hypothetical protein
MEEKLTMLLAWSICDTSLGRLWPHEYKIELGQERQGREAGSVLRNAAGNMHAYF